MVASASERDEEALRRAVLCTPIIDNHAHPLLRRDAMGRRPLLSVATEAHGEALDASRTGLAHFRAVRQLADVLGCEATWEAVAAAVAGKREGQHDAWLRTCLAGIQCVLVDDGLDDGDAEPYHHFDRFTPCPARRIVRIEQLAVALVESACTSCPADGDADEAFRTFARRFDSALADALADPVVVGFKSVICYRTGLAIPPTPDADLASEAFREIFRRRHAPDAEPFARVDHAGLNEYLVHRLAAVVAAADVKKPIQFHTGLGDNDITLSSSSPSHLQPFIRRYPTVPVVLLHSGYPFVRETGYLATMYENVYADIGEVFPFLSRDGQRGVVRQMLELCPSTKMLWSTDGHWFPETYYLAVVQMREVLAAVLTEHLRAGDLSGRQAVRLVEDLLFHNANRLYGLRLQPRPTGLAVPVGRETSILCEMRRLQRSVRFLRVCWNDLTATTRMRSIPVRRVISMLESDEELSFGVTRGVLGMIQNDGRVPGVDAVGEWRLHPDFGSLREGPRANHATVMADFREEDGSPVLLCPRTLLRNTLALADAAKLSFTVGFEIEVVILRRTDRGYEALHGHGHAYSASRAMDHDVAVAVVESAVEQLEAAGIHVEMVHPEAATGQYEVVLPKAPPLEAVDNLLLARNVISCCATARGYRATLHPKPFPDGCGSASHLHMSMASPDGCPASLYESFYAGVLHHLRAVMAFTCSNLTSYERIRDRSWAGGTWVAWGTQNRETPLRKIKGGHWELKCMDGLANPYLAVSAVIAAGLDGVKSRMDMTWRDCTEEPSLLGDGERARLGITTTLPSSLEEALASLQMDTMLCSLLGEEIVERYVAIKRAEIALMQPMDYWTRREWVIERY
ncbi:hypothetical protein RJ55_07306 [Drechmeria coniospora]|nr:hypothetical protein RJ55_07306 [Drechmeria coniospora]